jgi:hypothetical protein
MNYLSSVISFYLYLCLSILTLLTILKMIIYNYCPSYALYRCTIIIRRHRQNVQCHILWGRRGYRTRHALQTQSPGFQLELRETYKTSLKRLESGWCGCVIVDFQKYILQNPSTRVR